MCAQFSADRDEHECWRTRPYVCTTFNTPLLRRHRCRLHGAPARCEGYTVTRVHRHECVPGCGALQVQCKLLACLDVDRVNKQSSPLLPAVEWSGVRHRWWIFDRRPQPRISWQRRCKRRWSFAADARACNSGEVCCLVLAIGTPRFGYAIL